jgi:phage N-6-adenine-methyltransferase
MQLTTEETSRYYQLKQKCKSAWIDFATAILEIRERRLYLVEHSTFEDFCAKELSYSGRHIHRLISSASVIENLKLTHGSVPPQTERQTRPLTKLEPELQREAWAEVIEENEPEKITARIIAEKVETKKELNQAVKEVKRENQPDTIFVPQPLTEKEILKRAREIEKQNKTVHLTQNSGNNEWYTPTKFIESARLVMGSIDLDPASSEIANKTVKAKKYYTQQDNGLSKKWAGNVWLNPPYSKDLINGFIDKVATQKGINNICVLVNNATETAWGQKLLNLASCICLIKTRIKFLDYTGTPAKSPLQGQMVVFKGKNTAAFITEFSKHGVCLKK